MAAEDKNTRLKSNMTIAILPGVGRFGARRRLVFSALEGDVDIYTIIFAALAVFIFLRLRSVLGQRTGSERPFRVSAFTYRLSMIAAVLCAVHYVAYEAKWYSALEAAVTPITTISGLARVVDGDTVVRGHIIGNGTPPGGCAGLVFSALEGLEGWSNYFGYCSRSKAYRSIDQYVFERVRRFLARRHKVPKTGAEEGQAARRAPA